MCLDGEKNDRVAFQAPADYQNHAIGWLHRGYSSLGGGKVVRIPRIWMAYGECRLQAFLPSTVPNITAPYRVSSMKVIGIRCWPNSRCALPGGRSEGAAKAAVRSNERPLTLSCQSAARRPMLPPRPLSQREHPHAGTDGRVSPSLISLKYCYVPLSGRGPPIAHDVRLETRALFAFTIDTCI